MKRELLLVLIGTVLGVLLGWGVAPSSSPRREALRPAEAVDAFEAGPAQLDGKPTPLWPADSSAGASREPAPVEGSVPSAAGTMKDPCADLQAQLARLEDEAARLRKQNELLRAYGGETPYDAFLLSPDADLIQDPADRKWLKSIMSSVCPFYLRPGEAAWLVERRSDWGGYESFEELVIRFLGPERVLREAPPGWTEWMAFGFTDEEWHAMFGQPPPEQGPAAMLYPLGDAAGD